MASTTPTAAPSSPAGVGSGSETKLAIPFVTHDAGDLFNPDEKERAREEDIKSRNMNVCKNIVMVDPLSPAAVAIHFLSRPGATVHRVFSKVQPEHELSDVHRGVKLTFAKPDDNIRFREPPEHPMSSKNVAARLRAIPELKAVNGPHHVLAACEMAVEPADHLGAELGLRHNVLELAEARRDKYAMQDRLRQCGLRSIHQMRYSRSTPWSEVEAFLAHPRLKPPVDGPDAKCQFRCVIKPVRSSGTDGVTFCSTIEEVKAAHEKILGQTNRLGISNESCVMQELLEGVEHIVDTVSCEGLHKTTAVWQYQKGPANGSRFVYIGMKTLPSDDPMFVPLVKYVHQVIDALGVRYGPTHAEVMFCKDGSPCLVEVGSRFQGVQGMWTDPANEAIGYNQIDAMVDLLVDPAKYWALPRVPLKLIKHARQIFVISPVSGILESMPYLDKLNSLPSCRKATFYVKFGQQIHATIDGWSSPGNVILVGPPEELERDYNEALRLLSLPDFFSVQKPRDDCIAPRVCRSCA